MPATKIWNGTAWVDLAGPQGPAGPTVVSADAGNASRLGTDGKLYTPTVTPPAAATTAPLNPAATAAVGTSLAYARADHVHQLPIATATVVGGVKQGTNITIAADGTISSSAGGISQADADARYVNITGDTMTGGLTTTSITAGPARSVFSANNEQYGIGVKYAPAGGAVYFGAASASATPDAVISGAGGSPLMTLTNGGNVGIGTASPQHRLDVEGIASVHGLSIDSNDTNGGHISAEPAGLSVWRGKWGTGDLIGWWRSDALEHYSDNSVSFVGSTCADTTNAGSFACVRAYHVSSGSVQLIAYPGGGHYAYSDGTGGTFNIGTASTKDLYLYTNNANRLLVSKDGPATAYSSWTFTQNATFQGTTNTFPARSINNNAVAFATPKQINVAAYTVVAADAGTILWNVHTAADAFINLPTDAEAAIPVGAIIRIMADTTRLTYIRPNAGASLFWQASSSGSFPDNSTRQGGSGPTFATRPLGRLSLTQVVKVAANTWYHFPN
jgi:hypothetical protein